LGLTVERERSANAVKRGSELESEIQPVTLEDDIMIQKTARIVLFGSLLAAPLVAAAMPAGEHPFPKDVSTDHRIEVAMSGSESPFPRDDNSDNRVELAMSGSESPFPADSSSDHRAERSA